MVVVKLLLNINIYTGLELEKDKEYVMAGAVMRHLQKLYPGSVSFSRNFDDIYKPLDIKNLAEGQEVCLFRSGGIGDVMFMLPLVKYLNQKYKARVKVGTSPMYTSILKNNPYIDKVFKVPFDVEEFANSNHHLMFEGLIEDAPEKSQILNAVDLFLNHAGVDFSKVSSEDKCPKLYLSDEEAVYALRDAIGLGLSKEDRKIGIQIQASSPIRNIPIEKIVSIIKILTDRGDKVVLFGGKDQIEFSRNLVTALGGKVSGMINYISEERTLRQSIAMAGQMDVIVAPDSSFIHIAGGLGVPVVGVYGCFPSMLRMKYYKNAIGIDCDVVCAPSFIHGHDGCVRGNPSPCFSVIKPEDIINAIDHLFKGKSLKLIYPTYNEFIDGEFKDSPFSTLKA